MDSEENYSMKVMCQKKVSKRYKDNSSSSESNSDDHVKDSNKKTNKNCSKKRVPSVKYKRKNKRQTSSDSSSSSVDSSTSSSDSSSSTSEEERNRRKKKQKKKGMKKLKREAASSKTDEGIEDGPSNDIPLELMGENRSMAPMTKEEWEKKQSVIRRVYDESTGRNRLVKGDGEVIEEIVSRDRHKQINEQATKGDGDFFQKHSKHLK